MNSNAFAKGDALARLIELIGADNKAFKAQDAELLAAINEVRDMFNTDELTVCSWDELMELASAGKLEPGHKYKINHVVNVDNKELVDLTISAKSESTVESIAVADDYLVHISKGALINKWMKTDCSYWPNPEYLISDADGDFSWVNEYGRAIDNTRAEDYNQMNIGLAHDAYGFAQYVADQYGLEYIKFAGSKCYLYNPGGNLIISISPDTLGSGLAWVTNYGDYMVYAIVKVGGLHDAIAFDDLVKLISEGSKDSFAGTNDVTSLESLPVTKSTINAEVGSSQTLSWSEGLPAGREVLAIIHNTGEEKITITLPDNCNAGSIDIKPGEYAEASLVNINGYYTRVSVEEVVSGATEDTFKGTNEAASISNIPVDKPVVDAYISGDGTLSFAEGLEDGREVLVVVHNESDADALIILPDNCNEDTIIIPANGYNEVSVANINGIYYTRVPSATSGPDTFVGTNEVTSLTNLPVDKSTIKAEISTVQTLSWSEGLPAGREVLAIIHNTGSDNISINLPANCNADSIKIKAGEYIEASLVNIDGYYTRVSIEEVVTGGSGEAIEYEEITAADVQAMFNGTYGI